ncbi:MAG TPA: Dyp-type peroxidase [Solirubrobacteraceae bacterium]|nr:Dyp-type peroxidase [Solirubrobacteraceae bacterium]
MTLDRRQFLVRSGLLGASGAATAGGELLGAGAAEARPRPGRDLLQADGPLQLSRVADPGARLPAVPFHGIHQAGIVTPAPPAGCFAAFDVHAAGRSQLVDLLQTLTGTARFLTAGGRPPSAGAGAPAADSGTLGPVVPADGLTVTLGAGASLFDRRYGLAARKPAGLFAMASFPDDHLDHARCGGDLMLSICAGSADTATHALREIARRTRGAMGIRWRIDGFVSPARPTGVPRNHQGFKDGIANPDVRRLQVAERLLWHDGGRGGQAWTAGGTYHVIRAIRMFTEAWDELPVGQQERIVGRRRDSGAPLSGRVETDAPDYAADPHGRVTPLRAHIRLANPRTRHTEGSRILRRSFNYDRGVDARGRLDMGLIFNCYQRDIRRQFEAVQARLRNEPMARFISPFGGGYFFTLPGVRDPSDWYGSGLLGT